MNSTEQKPPVSVGEEYEVSIKSVGAKGDGIARIKNFIIIVAGTKKGDNVKIRITKVSAKVGFADVITHVDKPKQTSVLDLADAPEERFEDTEDFGEDNDETE